MRRPENDQSKNKPSRSRREGWLTKADPKFLILPFILSSPCSLITDHGSPRCSARFPSFLIETRSLPLSLAVTLTALPSMSLLPFAPFFLHPLLAAQLPESATLTKKSRQGI